MTRSLRRLPFQPRRPRAEAGVTLVELLVALLISSVFLPLIWTSIRGAIQFFEATIWQVQLERDLDRLTTLLDAEAEDACLFGTNADPPGCVPLANFVCDGTQRNELRMRATLLDANNAPTGTRVVRYFLQDAGGGRSNLLRSGPAVLPNGQLDPNAANNQNNQLVMRGLTVFTVTPNNDCNNATIVMTVQPVAPNVFTAAQGFGNAVTRTLGLRTGSRPFVD